MSEKRLADRLRGVGKKSCFLEDISRAVFGEGIQHCVDCEECQKYIMEKLAREMERELAEERRRGRSEASIADELNWEYRFPALSTMPLLYDQSAKIVEEAVETQKAVFEDGWELGAAAIEAMDVIHAAETLLRRLEGDFGVDLDEAYAAVVAKNRGRGYYGKEA